MADENNSDKHKKKRSPASTKHELQESEFIARLVPDPTAIPSLTVLGGYLGKSPTEGRWRLYLNTKLNLYVDIAERDIVLSQSLATEQAPLGAVRVWVRSNATLSYTSVTSRQVQAEFLQGSIMGGFGSSPAAVPAAIAASLRASRVRISIDRCPSDPGSTCEDVCTTTRQLCGETIDCGGTSVDTCITDEGCITVPGCRSDHC